MTNCYQASRNNSSMTTQSLYLHNTNSPCRIWPRISYYLEGKHIKTNTYCEHDLISHDFLFLQGIHYFIHFS